MKPSCLLVVAGLSWFASQPLFGERTCFETQLAGPLPYPEAKAALHLTLEGMDPSALTVSLEERLALPGKVWMDLPRAGLWQARVESEAFWAEPWWGRVEEKAGPPCVVLKLFPLARLEGVVLEPPAQSPLDRFEVRFTGSPSVPAANRLPRGKVSCPMARDRRFSCAVPAGQADLRLSIPGFVPFYFWDLPLQASRPHSVGTLLWEKGASVVGWIEPPKGAKTAGKALLEITPELVGDVSRAEEWERARQLTRKVAATERGFFQFRILDPGNYRLSVEHPEWVAPTVFPVEVRRELETEISQSILLSPPAALKVQVEPPVSPGGIPWTVGLEARVEANFLPGQAGVAGSSAEGGLWHWRGLAPGSYQLSIQGEDGALWWREPVEVSAGMAPLAVEIPLVPIRGRIWLGKEPLSAHLVFGGRLGKRRIPIDSDEEGRFSGLLTTEGEWRIDLTSESPWLRMTVPPVEVRKRPGKSYAEVEIRLPDTWLRGEVVDEKGKPLPEAQVQIQIGFGNADVVRVDPEGKFEVRGLAPGPASLEARAGERTSDWVPMVIEEGAEEGSSIRLIARLKTTLAGRVSAAGSPVAGARLRVWPDRTGMPVMNIAMAVTGPTGEFTVSLPAGLTAVNVMTMAPGFPLQWRRLSLSGPPRIEIQLATVGGTLVLSSGSSSVEPAGMLVHGGTFVPVNSLAEWMRLQPGAGSSGGSWVVPQVEPGEYLLCRGPQAGAALNHGLAPPEGTCNAGHLPVLGELALSAPELAPAPAGPEEKPE